MTVIVSAGAGAFPAGTTVASITDATRFEASAVPVTALPGGTTVVSGFPAPASYISASGATSAATLVTVASTAGLSVGMRVYAQFGPVLLPLTPPLQPLSVAPSLQSV